MSSPQCRKCKGKYWIIYLVDKKHPAVSPLSPPPPLWTDSRDRVFLRPSSLLLFPHVSSLPLSFSFHFLEQCHQWLSLHTHAHTRTYSRAHVCVREKEKAFLLLLLLLLFLLLLLPHLVVHTFVVLVSLAGWWGGATATAATAVATAVTAASSASASVSASAAPP